MFLTNSKANECYNKANDLFQQEILPRLKDVEDFSGTWIDTKDININGSSIPISTILDRNCGVDAIQIKNDNSIKTWALRVQSKDYDTFTIRFSRDSGAKTEYEKRISSMKCGTLYPTWTLQAYFRTDGSISIGYCSTKELYKYVKDNFNTIDRNEVKKDGKAQFLYVPFKNKLKTMKIITL